MGQLGPYKKRLQSYCDELGIDKVERLTLKILVFIFAVRDESWSTGGTSNIPIENVKVGYPGDFSAHFKAAWDKNFLYLTVKVIDDKFVRLPDKHGNYNWYNDTLQVYIDTMCDAKTKNIKGFDGNDYNYDFFPNPSRHNAVAFRRFAPEQQAAGGLFAPKPNTVEPNIKTAFKFIKHGYLYEIAFPKQYIMPMKLEEDYTVGFCIYLNDRDGKYIKSGLTLTPRGTGGYMNPHLYPMMLLTE